MTNVTYNDADHSYHLDGVRVPSVTQILGDLLRCWQASEWHLQRGTAIHACAAFIADGKPFAHDPQIDGQVHAAEKWFSDFTPEVLEVERIVASRPYRYAGRFDLLANIGTLPRPVLVDWKASFTDSVPFQLAAYAVAYGNGIRDGVAVVLNADGSYKMSQVFDLRRYRAEWLAMRTTYGIRERLGKTGENNVG